MPTKLSSPDVVSPAAGALRTVNEPERLEALRNYQILDTPPEEVFDDLTRLAAYICGTPVSLVSLIDSNRQWFKAKTGFDGVESTEREVAFCQYAMLAEDIFEVEDARQDPMFQNYPLVKDEKMGVRFYAGAPLITPEGQPLGTLCTMDTVPRRLSAAQRDALRILAREVVSHLELRRARLQLEQEQLKLDGLLRMANNTADSLMINRSEIFIKQENKLIRIKTGDIRYVEALGDYVNIHLSTERFTVYSTMKELEAKLPPRDFARVHRKYIVRLNQIVAIEGDALLVDGKGPHQKTVATPVPIGSSYKAALLGRLNLV